MDAYCIDGIFNVIVVRQRYGQFTATDCRFMYTYRSTLFNIELIALEHFGHDIQRYTTQQDVTAMLYTK